MIRKSSYPFAISESEQSGSQTVRSIVKRTLEILIEGTVGQDVVRR